MKNFLRKLARFILNSSSDKRVEVKIAQINYGKILFKRNIVITGGGSGLGLEMAKKFTSEGANVVISGRDEKKLKDAVKNIGNNIKYIVFDVTNINKQKIFLNKCEELLDGDIDTLVCNAGISLHENNFINVTEESFDKQFDTNFKSTYFLSKYFLEYALKNKNKSNNLLIISSETGNQCYDIPYGLTKNALNSMIGAMSRRVYKDGIRVNGIAPGVTISNMTKNYADVSNGNLYRNCASDRIFLPEEVAEVATFLISDASKCISGEVLHTNAGNHLSIYWNE